MTQEQKPKTPWYFTTGTLIFALLSAGPLALPLLWANPRFSILQKVVWSIVVLAATYYLAMYTMDLFNKIMAQYKELGLIQ